MDFGLCKVCSAQFPDTETWPPIQHEGYEDVRHWTCDKCGNQVARAVPKSLSASDFDKLHEALIADEQAGK